MGILNAALRGVSCKTKDVPTFNQIILFFNILIVYKLAQRKNLDKNKFLHLKHTDYETFFM